MKVIAFTRLHYGADYLDAVIRSTEGFAEKHVILYTARPTFGTFTDMSNADSREGLLAIAQNAAWNRVDWVEGVPIQPETVVQRYPDADIVLELDGDEVIHQDLFTDILRRVEMGELTENRYRLPFLHHWRSFKYGCTDGQWPIRLYLPKNPYGTEVYYPRSEPQRYVHHFGYARDEASTRYKWEVSMHRSELRPEWWGEIWGGFPNRLNDVHPVCRDGFWNAGEIADGDLPAALINHPYRYLEVIK